MLILDIPKAAKTPASPITIFSSDNETEGALVGLIFYICDLEKQLTISAASQN